MKQLGRLIFYLSCVLAHACVWANGEPFGFTRNAGQWPSEARYRLPVPTGYIWLENTGYTLHFFDYSGPARTHMNPIANPLPESYAVSAVRVQYIGAQTPTFAEREPGDYYENFFLGADSSKWASNVPNFAAVDGQEIYPGIDVEWRFRQKSLKYAWTVAPGADPTQIKLHIQGADSVYLQADGTLALETPVTRVVESAPVAFQQRGARLIPLKCAFHLQGDTLTYSLPDGYDSSLPLVIDPQLNFSSYSGSSASNFGFTATPDQDGNLYAGGVVFGDGYPTVAGSWQETFAGGQVDCGISKFNANGTQLLFTTYLGGSGDEAPHSMVVGPNNELFVLGTTGSDDFPTNGFVLSTVFQGGQDVTTVANYGFTYPNGTDLFVTRFSADGTNLIASTFLGGPGNEGINFSNGLEYNYGDTFRGEILFHPSGDVLIATVCQGSEFPVSQFAAQNTYGGGDTDGLLIRLSPDLNNLVFATYLGGSAADAIYAVQTNAAGDIYVVGGTTSANFPTTQGAHNTVYGGQTDSFVSRLSANGQTLQSSTLLGSSGYDQAYFIQLNSVEEPYILGQCIGPMETTNGVYINTGSGQYIRKYSSDLSSLEISTRIGTNTLAVDFSPSAFLVNACDQVYVSGWGGNTNATLGNATFSGTLGLPITDDAFQSTSDDADFYLMVLSPELVELEYATFFGGGFSSEHVDGGTSRFDKGGAVYQAVCAGCFGNDDFPTQPGVVSPQNGSQLCNLGVFKFDLNTVSAQAAIQANGSLCVGSPVQLINISIGSDTYQWDFGDGTTSTEESPNHVYTQAGDYTIQLVASASEGCIIGDTLELPVTVVNAPQITIDPVPTVCPGTEVTLTASGVDNIGWTPPGGLSETQGNTVTATVNDTVTYTAVGTNECGEVQASVTINVYNTELTISGPDETCPDVPVALNASGALDAEWTDVNSGEVVGTGSQLVISLSESTSFQIAGATQEGCTAEGSFSVSVLEGPPELTLPDTATSCKGVGVQLNAGGTADSYLWEGNAGLSAYNVASPYANPTFSTAYIVAAANFCGVTNDTVFVEVQEVDLNLSAIDTACANNGIEFSVTGNADRYRWFPEGQFSPPEGQVSTGLLNGSGYVSVIGYTNEGCFAKDSALVFVWSQPQFTAGNSTEVPYGEPAQLRAVSNHPVVWDEHPGLSCLACPDPEALVYETTWFTATTTSPNGCTNTDSVEVYVLGSLYIPNAFTPDGDGVNDLWRPEGIDIERVDITVYNRWGEPVYLTADNPNGWNGSMRGGDHYVPLGVYNWVCTVNMGRSRPITLRGTVTVIR